MEGTARKLFGKRAGVTAPGGRRTRNALTGRLRLVIAAPLHCANGLHDDMKREQPNRCYRSNDQPIKRL